MRAVGVAVLSVLGSLVVACGASNSGFFDVEKVKANWVADCEEIWDSALEQDMCDNAAFDTMSASGLTLIVPTSYRQTSGDRAAELCEIMAVYHNDGDTGRDLGYRAIQVLDVNGAEAARCTTRY